MLLRASVGVVVFQGIDHKRDVLFGQVDFHASILSVRFHFAVGLIFALAFGDPANPEAHLSARPLDSRWPPGHVIA